MEDNEFIATMESIVSSTEQAGADLCAQLYGYLNKGKEECITRNGNARELIKAPKRQRVWAYVKRTKE